MKHFSRKMAALGIMILVASSSIIVGISGTVAKTSAIDERNGNGQSAPLIPVVPPNKPIHVADGTIGCHPHDCAGDTTPYSKGIGKVPCWITPSHGLVQTFSVTSTNPYNGLYYNISFGDGQYSGWIGPYNAGQVATAYHDYNNIGVFPVTARVKLDVIVSDLSPPLAVRMYKTGDINADDCIGFGDINPFVALIVVSGGCGFYDQYPNGYRWAGDINLDCAIGFGDINPFVQIIVDCSDC